MKLTLTLIWLVVVLAKNTVAQSISTEEFEAVTNTEEREQIIAQAPPEQKESLKKIDHHLRLLKYWHGDEGLKEHRETLVATARGFGALMGLGPIQLQVWELYMGSVWQADIQRGISREQADAEQDELEKERSNITNHGKALHNLVFNLAVSPRALELNKEATALLDETQDWMHNRMHYKLKTKTEMAAFNKKIDDLTQELITLPKLTPEQVEIEYNAMTEDKLKIVGSFK